MLLVTSHPRVKLHGAFNEDCMAGHSFEISEGVAHLARYVEIGRVTYLAPKIV